MALSVYEALVLSEGTYHVALLVEVEKYIDERLGDAQYRKNWICGSNSDEPFFRFAVPGTATNGDKKEIKRRYEEKGWINVMVMNSSENKEAPGLIGITIGVPLERPTTKIKDLLERFVEERQKTGELSGVYSPRQTSEEVRLTFPVAHNKLTSDECDELAGLFTAAGWSSVCFYKTYDIENKTGNVVRFEVVKDKGQGESVL